MKLLENLHIEASTAKLPTIDLNSSTGDLVISGRSIPENANKIYEPVMDWVKEYIKNPKPETNLKLNIEYFNTATSLWLAKIANALSTISNHDYVLFIHFYFGIDDFDEMDYEDIKDELAPLISVVVNATVSVGFKIYGIGEKGEILKENMVLL
jgi:hypothetical protein